MEKQENNIQSIQFLRGIAAFSVLLLHTNLFANGWMGVELFFIISGFIIPYSMYNKNYRVSDFGSFFIKRISRIEPPYIVSIAMVLLLNYSTTWSSWYKGPAFVVDWRNVLGHLGYLNAFTNQPWLNVAYWTLAIEFEYYLILALAYPLIVNKNKLILMASFFILLATTFIAVPGRHIIVYFPFFLMGIALFLFKIQKIKFIEYLIMTTIAQAVCFYKHGPTLFVVAIATLLCIYYIKKVPKPFLLLGTISYSLYLTHNVMVSRFMALSARYVQYVNINVVYIACVLFCLLIAWLFYIAVERPFINLSKKIKFHHKRKSVAEVI